MTKSAEGSNAALDVASVEDFADLVIDAALAVVMTHDVRDNGDSHSVASMKKLSSATVQLLPVRRG